MKNTGDSSAGALLKRKVIMRHELLVLSSFVHNYSAGVGDGEKVPTLFVSWLHVANLDGRSVYVHILPVDMLSEHQPWGKTIEVYDGIDWLLAVKAILFD